MDERRRVAIVRTIARDLYVLDDEIRPGDTLGGILDSAPGWARVAWDSWTEEELDYRLAPTDVAEILSA